jgi:bacteriorhodopsin
MSSDRFAYYALGIQALISLVVLVLSFYAILQPTEPTVNQVAGNLVVFVTGVWLGRGADYGLMRWRNGGDR